MSRQKQFTTALFVRVDKADAEALRAHAAAQGMEMSAWARRTLFAAAGIDLAHCVGLSARGMAREGANGGKEV